MKTPTHYGGIVLAATVSKTTIDEVSAAGPRDANTPAAESGCGAALEASNLSVSDTFGDLI